MGDIGVRYSVDKDVDVPNCGVGRKMVYQVRHFLGLHLESGFQLKIDRWNAADQPPQQFVILGGRQSDGCFDILMGGGRSFFRELREELLRSPCRGFS